MRIPFHPALYPPAPALEIRLVNPSTGVQTIIPTTMLTALRLSPMRSESVSGLWGGHSVTKVYLVDIEIGGRLLSDIEVLSNSREKQILIGRDVSNQLRLLLDGLDLSTEILTE